VDETSFWTRKFVPEKETLYKKYYLFNHTPAANGCLITEVHMDGDELAYPVNVDAVKKYVV